MVGGAGGGYGESGNRNENGKWEMGKSQGLDDRRGGKKRETGQESQRRGGRKLKGRRIIICILVKSNPTLPYLPTTYKEIPPRLAKA